MFILSSNLYSQNKNHIKMKKQQNTFECIFANKANFIQQISELTEYMCC